MKVSVAAYGLGNIGSLEATLRRIGCNVEVIQNPEQLAKSSHIIVPGVGHFGRAMQLISSQGWDEALRVAAREGSAVLGICLGMQILAESSEESPRSVGIGLLKGTVRHLRQQDCPYRIPHVGWNSVQESVPSALLAGVPVGCDFYFVHSYSFEMPNSQVTAVTDYGIPIAAIAQSENVFGVQFHPEKSSGAGRRLLANFANFQPC